MIPFFSNLIRAWSLNPASNILIFVHPSVSLGKEAVLFRVCPVPGVTGNKSDNYTPAAEN